MTAVLPVLLIKAHVRDYFRRTQSGQSVHVGEYENKRQAALHMFGEATQRASQNILGLLARHKAQQEKPEPPPPAAEAKKPAAEKPQPRYKKTVMTGKPAEEQKPEADKPPAAVVTGVKRIAEHGDGQIATDFANLSMVEQFAFTKWLAVYDKALADNPDLTTAQKYMRVVRRQAGMAEVPQTDEERKSPKQKESDAQKTAFRAELDKAPDGMSFIIPQSDEKGLVGQWTKVSVADETYWKKGGKYLPSEAFVGHAAQVKKQIAAGGVKKPAKVGIAAKKPQERVKPLNETAATTAPDQKTEKPTVQEGKALRIPDELVGKESKVWTEAGTEVKVRYAVLPRGNLITSHDTALRENKAFPQELQPRDRSRLGLEDQVNNIGKKLIPEKLGESTNAGDGAPIVSRDGVVESGNGRTIALGQLYEGKHENATKYVDWLKTHAEDFGLTADAVEGIKEPVLVRVRTSDVDREAFVHEANIAPQAAASPSEKAQADAKKLSPDIMQWFAPSEDGDVTGKENANFVSKFFREVVGESERNELLTAKGDLNDDGTRRIRNAVLVYVYPDPDLIGNLVETGSSVMRNVGNSLLAASGRFATLKGAIARGEAFPLDPGKEVAEAARTLMHLKEQGIHINDFLNQPPLVGEEMSPESKAFLTMFANNIRKPKEIRNFLTTYADVAEASGDPRQTGMFAQSPPNKLEVIEATRRAVAKRADEGDDDEGKLFKSAGRRSAGTALPILPILRIFKTVRAASYSWR